MSWHELAENPQIITELYDETPSLQKVDIHKVILKYDENKCLVFFDLPTFADKPPAKWVKYKYNTVQIHLAFLDIESFQVERWSTNNCADAQIEMLSKGRIAFKVAAPTCHVEGVARAFRFIAVNGYRRSIS